MKKQPKVLKLTHEQETAAEQTQHDKPMNEYLRNLILELNEAYREELSRKAKLAAKKRKRKKTEAIPLDSDSKEEN